MRRAPALLASLALCVGVVSSTAAAANASSVYRVQVDATPPPGQPWVFNRFFPHILKVHQGDVIQADWGGTDAPHAVAFVPASNANSWRASNQAPGDPFALVVPDSAAGGDDGGDFVVNPAVAGPSSFGCGDSGNPCSADGSSVVSSGFQFSNPNSEPSFFVQVNAPVGHYSFLCLIHSGMQIPLQVVAPDDSIPSPQTVAKHAAKQIVRARTVDGPTADAQAQQLQATALASGRTRWTISAGGFSNQVTANEYRDDGVTLHLGDQLKVVESSDPITGSFELHTATFPIVAANTTPFLIPQCEVAGADTPPPCGDPSEFRLLLNPRAAVPTSSGDLRNTSAFVNSGLFAAPGQSYVFTARRPGTYTMVCLVHGPSMTTTVTVVK